MRVPLPKHLTDLTSNAGSSVRDSRWADILAVLIQDSPSEHKPCNRPSTPANLDDPALYINRDLSWLEFNRRVLEEAQDSTVPMLERLKFLAIFSSNLDEFYMVRVGGIQQKVQANIPIGSGADQMSPRLQLEQVRQTTCELVAEQYRVLHEEVLPALAARGIVLRTGDQLSEAERVHVRGVFTREIFPVLTPLSTDPAHPFPHLQNKSLNLAVTLHKPNDADPLYAVVQVPGVLPRFLPLPGTRVPGSGVIKRPDAPTEGAPRPAPENGDASPLTPESRFPAPVHAFLPLEDAIRLHLGELFPGMELGPAVVFRVTRDSEYELDDEVDDLLEEIEAHVRARRRGHPVRLEIETNAPADMVLFLTDGLNLNAADVCPTPRPLDLTGLFHIHAVPGFADLRDPPFTPSAVSAFAQATNPWSVIRGRDVLVFHPFESFAPVVEFIEAAAADDRVLAIKQTLYRTSSDSPIVRALQRAADRGKQVTAVVELKARMDEERNILWARELEKAGVHVVFGFVGLKTHCKVALVVRRDEDHAIRRYVHLGTGNYNPQTARVYTDLGLFTCNPDFAEDVTLLFNHLTASTTLPPMRKLLVAPSRLASADDREDRPRGRESKSRQARAAVGESERDSGTGGGEGAVPREPSGREDRHRVPRHLLAAAGRPGGEREHPRHFRGRPLPRAQPHLLLRERREPGSLRRQRGLDGPQPAATGGGGVPDRTARTEAARHRRAENDARGQRQGPRTPTGRELSARHHDRGTGSGAEPGAVSGTDQRTAPTPTHRARSAKTGAADAEPTVGERGA